MAVGQNKLICYIPFDSLNFEDAIVANESVKTTDTFQTVHQEMYAFQLTDKEFFISWKNLDWTQVKQYKIDQNDLHIYKFKRYKKVIKINYWKQLHIKHWKKRRNPFLVAFSHLNKQGFVKVGSWVEYPQILALRMTTATLLRRKQKITKSFPWDKNKEIPNYIRVPKKVQGRVLAIQKLTRDKFVAISKGPNKITAFKRLHKLFKRNLFWRQNSTFSGVNFSVSCYRNTQIGDKFSGRHGNKSVLARLIDPREIPFLPDGTPVDFIINPCGVPSRINLRQVYEIILGMAGFYLGEQYSVSSFLNKTQNKLASRTLAFSKVFEARIKNNLIWMFNPKNFGKKVIFDRRTSVVIDKDIFVGESYILKLVHIVEEKINTRSSGPIYQYQKITKQAVKGRRRKGGQRVGEMEIWALGAYGSRYRLREICTVKSDSSFEHISILADSLLSNRLKIISAPTVFQVLVRELQALCLNIFFEL